MKTEQPTTEAVDLKPCPFCGSSTAPNVELDDFYACYADWTVTCNAKAGGCGISMSRETKPEAVEAWNTRAAPEPAAKPVCTCKPPEHRGGCPIGRQYVKAWYMRDNHTFFAIDLDADENGIVGQVSEVFHGPCGSYGTLFVRWMPADDRLEDFTLHLHDKFDGKKVREWAQKIMALPRKQPETKEG